jgi:cell wall integrity and stress response component
VTSSVPIQTQNQQTITPQISISLLQTTTTVSFAAHTISTSSKAPTGPSKGVSGGAIGGIVVGVIGGTALIGGLLFFYFRPKHHQVDPVIKEETGQVIGEEFEDGFVAVRYPRNEERAIPWEVHGARTLGEY